MGNESTKLAAEAIKGKQKEAAAVPDVLNIKKYNKIGVIGRGGFGKVWKIENKKDRKPYALKEMSKASAVQEERGVSHERAQPAEVPQGRVPHQRALRLPGQGEPLPHHGPGQRRRPALPPHQKHQVQLRADQVLRVRRHFGPGVPAQQGHNPSGPQALEHRLRQEGLSQNH